MATTTFRIVIQDACLAAWHPANNTFRRGTGAWVQAADHWEGVIFQFGKYRAWGQNPSLEIDILTAISFQDANGNELASLTKAQLMADVYWINIVGRQTNDGRNEPMDVSHLQEAKLDSTTKFWHRSFKPWRGGMTFWPKNEYTIDVERGDEWHSKFTFTTKRTDRFSIKIYRNGSLVGDQSAAASIVVTKIGGGGHNDLMDPPQRP